MAANFVSGIGGDDKGNAKVTVKFNKIYLSFLRQRGTQYEDGERRVSKPTWGSQRFSALRVACYVCKFL